MSVLRPDPRRFEQRTTAKRRVVDCRTHDHRCEECGWRRPLRDIDGVPTFLCGDHPEANGVCWPWLLQAAAIAADQEAARGTSLERQQQELDQMAVDCDPAVGSKRYVALMTALLLLERWGGLPERGGTQQVERPGLYE